MSVFRGTEKQLMFIKEYVIDFNATKAAIRAGYSEATAYSIGSELLKKPEIQEAISDEVENRNKRLEISQERIAEELAKIAFADIKRFTKFGDGGKVDIRPDFEVDGAVISEISETNTSRGQTRRVKLHDKMKALELLGRYKGMYKDVLITPKEPEKLSLDEIEALEKDSK